MSGTHSNFPASALHPLSQISFRLSQRPPSSQRKARRPLDRTDSIEDSDVSDRMSIGTPSQENNAERHNRLTIAEKTTVDSIFDFTEPQTLSSPILSFASTASLRPLGTPTQQKRPDRVPLVHTCNRGEAASTGERESRPRTSPLSSNGCARSLYQIGTQGLQPHAPGLAVQHGLSNMPQTAMVSPLRPISTHRQAISPRSAPPDRQRSVISRRPDISLATVSSLATQREVPTATYECLQGHQALTAQNTPSKRPRYEGIASTEFRKVISQEASEFCMWWHCLSGELGQSRVCHRPQASFRLRVQSVQCVVQPHLFCVEAEIEDVASAEASPFLVAGASLTALLSVAVCMDALPLEAKKTVEKFIALEASTNPDVESSDSENHPLFVAVYEPWRVQGKGDQLCLFASRFDLE